VTQAPLTLSTALLTPSPYHVGYGIEAHFVDALKEHAGRAAPIDKVFFFTERALLGDVVGGLHERLREALPTALFTVPQGERGKGFAALEEALEGLIAAGATKRSAIVAAGGGWGGGGGGGGETSWGWRRGCSFAGCATWRCPPP